MSKRPAKKSLHTVPGFQARAPPVVPGVSEILRPKFSVRKRYLNVIGWIWWELGGSHGSSGFAERSL